MTIDELKDRVSLDAYFRLRGSMQDAHGRVVNPIRLSRILLAVDQEVAAHGR
jgi:hypothetical protein